MSDTADEAVDISFGTVVYDDEGTRLGEIRGVDEHGFYVTTDEGIAALSGEHVAAGRAGEAELTWRCYSCGAMGDIEELPEEGCPDCGAPQEDVYYTLED